MRFDEGYNSKNIGDMRNKHFSRVVCAGVSAVKWKANKNPLEDWVNIRKLMDVLATITVDEFVLISTVDVYKDPGAGLTELDDPNPARDNHPYGTHRLALEAYVTEIFPKTTIIRLPGLFGEGLKKNIIFDLLTDNQLSQVNLNGSFQWYDLKHLGSDIELALSMQAPHTIRNIAPAPVSTREIVNTLFPDKISKLTATGNIPNYNFKTCFQSSIPSYTYTASEVLADLKIFVEKFKTMHNQ